jgi:hypothetical protein
MAHYFFDFEANGSLSVDEEGLVLPDIDAAHDQALATLVDVAQKAVSEAVTEQRFGVHVRDAIGPVLEVTAVFDSKIFRKQ